MKRKLGDFIEEYSCKDNGKGYAVYSVTNSQGFCNEYFGKNVASADTSNYKVVPRGYFAYNPSRINVGSISWQNKEDFVSVSPLYRVFSVSPSLCQDYLLFFLKSNYCMSYINAFSRGAVRNNLKISVLKEFEIPYLPIDEQQKIVNELNLLRFISEKCKQQINELDRLSQSIFNEMFGDPIANEKGWDTQPLGRIASFKNGLNFHPAGDGYIIKCIGVGDFKDRKELRSFDFINGLTIDEAIDDSYYLEDGDIIIVRSNGSRELVGRNMIVYPKKERITYSGFCIRCRLITDNIIPLILNRILAHRSTMRVLRQEGRGSNISNINQKILSTLPIITPPIDYQKQFAEEIIAIEHQKELVMQSINEIDTLFNCRMDYYFN